jgi:Flp pilus assembly protein TadG
MPLFLALTLGTADGGRAFYYSEAVTNAARQALREASADMNGTTQPYAGAQACVGTGSTATAVSEQAHVPWQTGDWTYLQNIATAAALESSSNGTPAGSKIAGATLTVTWHCENGAPIDNETNGGNTNPASLGSDAVGVRISYNFTLLTPLVGRLFGSGTPVISAAIVGRVEY